jgi:ABC-type uncharacterized transport system ATPase subunit
MREALSTTFGFKPMLKPFDPIGLPSDRRRGRPRADNCESEGHTCAGLGMVYQHFTLVPAMTVAKNLVLAREIGGEVEVLIAANPCFGLDFAAVVQIQAEIMAARKRGAAGLLVSEDLDELLELSDCLVVMFHGQFVHKAPASEADLTEIGRHMAGH